MNARNIPEVQNNWNVGEWLRYMRLPASQRDPLLNVVSLSLADTDLKVGCCVPLLLLCLVDVILAVCIYVCVYYCEHVSMLLQDSIQAPKAVRDVDLVSRVWPNTASDKPKVC